jgi:hypothetical protein
VESGLPVVAGSVSTAIFVASTVPMLVKPDGPKTSLRTASVTLRWPT